LAQAERDVYSPFAQPAPTPKAFGGHVQKKHEIRMPKLEGMTK